jgi:hypothetical protein
MNAVFTACITIIGGTIIFIVKELIQKNILDPIYGLKQIISEIAFALDFYANRFGRIRSAQSVIDEKTKKSIEEASNQFRVLSCKLDSQIILIPKLLLNNFYLPSAENIHKAARILMGHSNYIWASHENDLSYFEMTQNDRENVKKLLRIQND